VGQACQTGACQNLFKYAPSNLTAGTVTSVAAAVTLNCGTSIFDSTNLTFTNWCGAPQPTPFTQSQTANGGPDVIVLAMSAFTLPVGNTLQITGGRGVMLVVYGDANVAGTILVSGAAATAGPGGNSSSCGAAGAGSNGRDGTRTGALGGGAGGAGHLTDGTDGATGTGGAGGLGAHGVALAAPTLIPLHGGCQGGHGGPSDVGTGGVGGSGGGALQLSVAGTLTVTGQISAAGGGGTGGNGHDGGGGGGSGGGVLLEAETLSVALTARIAANGGAGGEGGTNGGGNGANGADGSANGSLQALGGNASASAGNGGNGGALAGAPTAAQAGQSGNGGGGGGGGAAGRIRLNAHTSCSITVGSVVSPAATSNGATGCP
jgi:hypothetical protein